MKRSAEPFVPMSVFETAIRELMDNQAINFLSPDMLTEVDNFLMKGRRPRNMQAVLDAVNEAVEASKDTEKFWDDVEYGGDDEDDSMPPPPEGWEVKDEEEDEEESVGTVQRRPCRDGARCHDRRPAHRERFSHPIDESPVSTGKTPCKFGSRCFNQSAIHRERFSHPDE